jgi:two-component sensor histidine kinase
VLSGRAPWRSDVEARRTTLSLRAIPLLAGGERIGALVLLRDVSELRRRERELLTKDATIREVHHRVKNNLQTVAALLRLQARRIPSQEGRAALQEAMRRVATIALVHETLSEGLGDTVVFDDVLDRSLALAVEVADGAGVGVRIERGGTFGEMAGENATPLALVFTELVTNAVEHGLAGRPGTVRITAERSGDRLVATVADDGRGLPEKFVPGADGLGTQIVQALVGGELRGRIGWTSPPEGGTLVTVDVILRGNASPGTSDRPDAGRAQSGATD